MDPTRAKPASSGMAVGIDLGTSNTVVAYVDGGRATAISDTSSDDLVIPSVVSFHPSGNILVGQEAKDRRLQDPKNTIYGTKRMLGHVWSSREIAQARARFPYELRHGRGSSILVVARNKEYTLPEISAFVLRRAKEVMEAAAFEAKVSSAVITCPASFDEMQRDATRLAGKLAGLEVLRVLNEPTAAALAYGYGKNGQERILVYDFGGGTFDVTLLERQGDAFRVRATAGDGYLGGDDIDWEVADRIAEGFAARHFYDPRADKQVFEHVREAAEMLKIKLSHEERATIEIVDVAFGVGGKSLRHEFTMTRSELAPLVDPFIERTFRVCKRALAYADIDAHDVDQVLLVGGSTLIARVHERVAEFFGREPAGGVSPFEAVAVGAAIQACAMTEPAAEDTEVPTEEAMQLSRTIVPPPSRPRAPPRVPTISIRTEPPPPVSEPPQSEAPASSAAPVPKAAVVTPKPAASAPSRSPARWRYAALGLGALLLAVVWLVLR